MMNAQAFWRVVVWCLCLAGGRCLEAQPISSPVSDPRYDQIRGAYWGIKDVVFAAEQLRKVQRSGLNTVLLKDGGFPIREQIWQGWGEQSHEYNLRLLPVINFAGQSERAALQGVYRPYVPRSGQSLLSIPCPLDEGYWQASIGQRLEQLADLAQKTAIAGGVFDTEMYGGEIAVYTDVCLCDVCWQQFFHSTQYAWPLTRVKPEDRFQYLIDQQWLERYTTVQAERLQAILASIAQRIHLIQPDFAPGIMAYTDSWFYRGLLCGLGTPAKPVYVFTENTYLQGYTRAVEQQQHALDTWQCSEDPGDVLSHRIAYVPGLWLGRFFPQDVAPQLFALATHSAGYWFFTAESLWAEEPLDEPYSLHGVPDDYWEAFQLANDELDVLAQASTTSERPRLTPVYVTSYYDASHTRLLPPPSLAAFMQRVADWDFARQPSSAAPHIADPITWRGRVLLHGFKTSDLPATAPDAATTIRITHLPLAAYTDPSRYMLFDQEGQLLMQGTLDANHTTIALAVMAEYHGLVSLLVDSGANAAHVEMVGFPAVVEASVTFPLATNATARSYTLYVPPNQAMITVRGYCSTGEAASVAFRSPLNQEIQRYVMTDFVDIRFPVSPQIHTIPDSFIEQTLWEVTIAPVENAIFDDVQLHLYNHEFPYLLLE